MLERYELNFASLSNPETERLIEAIDMKYQVRLHETVVYGPDLMRECQKLGMDHASIVMSLANDPSPLAVVCLEKLVGKPITRPDPSLGIRVPSPRSSGSSALRPAKEPRAPRPVGAAVRKNDPRVITYVSDTNPKKSGTAAHTKFALYKVGMTVSQFIEAGGTTADVKWDTERGFIKLGE